MESSFFWKFSVSFVIVIASFGKLYVAVFSGNETVTIFGQFLLGRGYAQLYGLSIAECMDSCRVRTRCQSVNYLQRSLQCRLNIFSTDYESRLERRSGVVFILVKEYSSSHQLQCGNVTCSRYQNCVYETGQCVVTECRGLPRPKNGYKVGNTVRVGAKTLLYCDDNTYVLNALTLPVQTICQPDSNWTVGKLECFTIHDLCYNYLVSGPSGLLVESINASSTFDNSLLPEYAVLNGSASWAATYEDDESPYLEVKFFNKRHITGVATQGRDDDAYDQYVTSYSVAYSVDCITFNNVPDSLGDRMVFDGNTDMNSIVTNQFDSPVEALCVRINAITWNVHPSMRIDILGCEDNDISNYRLYTGD